MNPVKIELASYASWVAFEQLNYRGWILRFADGETKRANSVNVISSPDGSPDEMISYCEAFFNSRSQPTIFRLLSFVDSSVLDSKLADAGYIFIDPCLVLYQKITDFSHSSPSPTILNRQTWLETYCDISGIDLESQKTHAKILTKIPNNSILAIFEKDNHPVACALGVIHDDCFGIFDLVTRKENRNKGYATNLVKRMISWAKHHKITNFYLQITAENAPAIRLYEKLGYRYLYHYWYRVQRN